MKLQRIMAAALIAMGMATMAHADAQVWFTATPAGTAGSVISDGAAGSNTVLECDAARCDWDITMWVRPDAPWTSWHTNLWTDAADKVTVKSADLTEPAFDQTTAPQIGQGDNILVTAGGFLVGQLDADTNYSVLQFRLSKNKQLPITPQTSFVLAGIGSSSPGVPGGSTWVFGDGSTGVAYGANGPIDGLYETTSIDGAVPVIEIRNIPEPVSLAMLGMGALALVRRRR